MTLGGASELDPAYGYSVTLTDLAGGAQAIDRHRRERAQIEERARAFASPPRAA